MPVDGWASGTVRGARQETGDDGDWLVRDVPAAGATKTYRCPGCDHEIPPGQPHVVAWPEDWLLGDQAGARERRHWHTGCWSARGRRRARAPRPGRGPRY